MIKRTKIKIEMNNKVKTVWRNLENNQLFVKDNNEILPCEWVDIDCLRVAFYGIAWII